MPLPADDEVVAIYDWERRCCGDVAVPCREEPLKQGEALRAEGGLGVCLGVRLLCGGACVVNLVDPGEDVNEECEGLVGWG